MTDPRVSRGRRQVLIALLGVAVTTVAPACSAVDPIVRGGAATPPVEPTTTPAPALAGALTAAGLEAALAHQASTLAARSGVSKGLRNRLELVATGHRVHAVALAGPQPTRRPTAPASPSGSPAASPPATKLPRLAADTDDAVDTLHDQLLAAAKTYTTTAVRTTGSTALLWGSLTVSAQMAADAVLTSATVNAPQSGPPAGLPQVTDVAAAQQLLAQLHAIVWGYRAALAALSGADRDRAAADLLARMISRDALVGWLEQRKQKVPVAAPAYVPPVEPTTSGRAGSLIKIMETALLPFAGQWLAACDDRSRTAALSGLTASGRTSVHWGGPPLTWPGWPG